jgi:hypothetical protein
MRDFWKNKIFSSIDYISTSYLIVLNFGNLECQGSGVKTSLSIFVIYCINYKAISYFSHLAASPRLAQQGRLVFLTGSNSNIFANCFQ